MNTDTIYHRINVRINCSTRRDLRIPEQVTPAPLLSTDSLKDLSEEV